MTVLDKKITITMTVGEWHKVLASFGVALGFITYIQDKALEDQLQKVVDNIRGQLIEQTKEVPKP